MPSIQCPTQAACPATLSVVIAAYNAAATLPATLDSLLAQSRPADEIVVVDDGSRDTTSEVLQAYGDRVRTVRQPNGGLAAARAVGVALARGDFIALLDADDLCHPERLARQAAVLEAHPQVWLCCSEFSAFDADGRVAAALSATYYSSHGDTTAGLSRQAGLTALFGPNHAAAGEPALHIGPVYERMVHGNFIHPPTVMFRRGVLQAAGTFERGAGSMCDWDWLVRVARLGPVAFIDAPLLDYRLSPGQMSSPRNRVRSYVDIVQVAERICLRDPALFLRERQRFCADIGQFCLDAADALADEHSAASLHMLARSVLRYRILQEQSLRVLIKALTPQAWIVQRRAKLPPA
jgi:glycosyltransferase involved in cell wall biosynthesis